jgi:hypothetical protein
VKYESIRLIAESPDGTEREIETEDEIREGERLTYEVVPFWPEGTQHLRDLKSPTSNAFWRI